MPLRWQSFHNMKELYEKGELGRLQYMTCAHYQDMEGWPEYWKGFPPLMHPTHAVAPCLMLAGHLPDRVYARGSGKIRKELEEQYGCPYAFEAAFTRNTVYNNENTHLSFTQGGGHGGSHPHLVHEFVRSILEERPPVMDDIMGAYWTGTGICAHESAMQDGKVISIPAFEKVE